MSAVPVTIVGILTTADGNSQSATLIGVATISDQPPVKPPGTPTFPIALPPGSWPPGGGPPGPGYPPSAEHPIVIPPPPVDPPIDPGPPDMQPPGGKPPPANGGWGWFPPYGWGYFPAPGEPGPK